MARLNGSIGKNPTLGTARTGAWSAMRILRRFTIPEVAATAEAEANNVQRYVFGLAKTGYLRVVRARVSGTKMGSAIYALVNDTGPLPPRLHRDGSIYDANPRGEYK